MKLEKFCVGQMGIVMTLTLATLLGVMTLCADVGVMYYNYLRLQKGVEAAAFAGAHYLRGGVTLASASQPSLSAIPFLESSSIATGDL
jgi:Flp pilus assembly protein TadG